MKKYFILAAAAVVALAACSKNYIETPSEETRVINFSAVSGMTTKAPITGNIYGTSAPDFGMFAYALPDRTPDPIAGSWAANSSALTPYMDNVMIKYNNDDHIWEPYDESTPAYVNYYWPLSGSLTFIGYSPYMASGVAYAPASKTLTITNFTQANNINDQKDLMWATTNADLQDNQSVYTPGGGDKTGVNVVFHHALSQVKFFVKKAAGLEDYTLTVNSITFDAYSKGTFTIANDAITSTTAEGVTYNTNWTSQAKQDAFVFNSGGSNIAAPNYEDAFVQFGTQANMPVPQQLANGTQTFTITYSLSKGGIILGQKTISNVNLLGNDVKAWLPNTIYNYNIVIDLNKIYFNPTVSDWTPTSSQSIDVR